MLERCIMCLCIVNDPHDKRVMPVDIILNNQKIDSGAILEIAGKKYRVSIRDPKMPTLDRIDLERREKISCAS